MPKSNFFIRKSGSDTKFSGEKRKRLLKKPPSQKHLKKQPAQKFSKKNKDEDEIISSDEDSITGHDAGYQDHYSSEEETGQEKKLRLAKKYLSQLEEEERDKNDDIDTREAVSRRLKEEVLEEAGRLQKKKAHEYENVVPEEYCVLKGHNLSITCIVITSTEKYFFSASKDCSIIKWSIEEKKKLKTISKCKKDSKTKQPGHTGEILSLALSTDDIFLASGCRDKMIKIWNPDSLELLKTFHGHKAAITGLVFQRGSHNLMSASIDRSLKLWNLDEMGYVETLFGHQDAVTCIDCFLGETALTAGGRDNTCRIWKIVEESQLVFQAYGCSIDCVCVSSHQSFVSGGDDGTLLLWGVQKKKPMSKLTLAHGLDPESEEGNWIVSLSSLRNTDLLATGSKDGNIRLWKRDDDTHSLVPVSTIPICGFVNALQFSLSGKYLVVGTGQEHRLGRWWKLKECKNSIVIYKWNHDS